MAAPESISQLLENLNESIASRRRTLRILESPRFQHAYKKSSPGEKLKVTALVSTDDQEGIEDWVRDQLHQEYTEMTSRELREAGRQFGIPYYAKLPKATLLSEILAHARAAGRDGGTNTREEEDTRRSTIDALCNGTLGPQIRRESIRV